MRAATSRALGRLLIGGLLVLAALTPGVLRSPRAEASTLPAGFQDQIVFGNLTNPTAIRFAGDGRVFVAEKSGLIKVFDGLTDLTPTVFADLRTQVHNFWDRGLVGLELDPQFPTNPWVYVLYTHDAAIGGTAPRWGTPGATSDPCPTPPGPTTNGCVVSGRLSRLQAAGNVMTGVEDVLIEDWCQQYRSHSVGGLTFAADGSLYVSGGDGASAAYVDYGQAGEPPNPCGDPPVPVGGTQTSPTAQGGALRSQDLRTTGDPATLDGAILRVDPSTGDGLPGNPLYSSADPNERRIVASGFRNPFRMAIRPDTNELWAGDVGWNDQEEIDRIVDPTDASADNFGWPCYEGSGRQGGYDAANLSLCETLYSAGSSAVVTPSFAYSHAAPVFPGDPCPTGGSAISGLAFAPTSGSSYPAEYHGALFFADYGRNCIWAVPAGADGLPDWSQGHTFASNAGAPVDLQIGPEGDLFYADVFGTVHRIRYTGAPIAVIAAQPQIGPAPLTVDFDGTGSSDPAGDTISYAWDLDGDGEYNDSTSATPTYTYVEPGDYTVGLRVTDGEGASGTDSFVVTAGNTAPVPVIDAPLATTAWQVDDEIAFQGRASDAQDGDLPASGLSWSLVLAHCPSTCHNHFVETFSGTASGSFIAPDHEYPAHLDLRLTATDSQGLRSTVTVRLNPQTVDINVQSEPAGLVLALGSRSQAAPISQTVIAGSTVSVSAPSPQLLNGEYYRFDSWSDGGSETHNVVVPAATTLTATFTRVVGNPPPSANAGPDLSVASNTTFVLAGSGSDPDNEPLSCHWEQTGGPVAVIRDEDECQTTVERVTGPATLVFRLTVTDPAGETDTDEATVTIRRPGSK